jgi:phosphoglycolate phosphatase-like HAD superfamily hydrolase
MEIFLFDMDGVLLQPNGYLRALQETIRLAGLSLGFENVFLSEDQIAQFEALGISNEWLSSALCMAVLMLEKQKASTPVNSSPALQPLSIDPQPYDLDLQELFDAISGQPIENPEAQRALNAIQGLAMKAGTNPELTIAMVKNCESIAHSLTMNLFQELVLGSEIYEETYQKKAQFRTDSYLRLYDDRLLSEPNAGKLLQWAGSPGRGAAIMTNRPSSPLLDDIGAPEAEMGAALVGLENLPLVGFGEITWLAQLLGQEASGLTKPSWQHALVAVLSGYGWPVEKSLSYVGNESSNWQYLDLCHLQGSLITVFEDTPGGMISVREARNILKEMDIQVEVRIIGLSTDERKRVALAAHGAKVYSSINHALNALEFF